MRGLTGLALETEAEQDAAAIELIRSGQREAVVISLGGQGVLLASAEGCERFASPNVKVQSWVGGGDSMVGGLALSRGDTQRDVVRFGIPGGTATVMQPGTELCCREDAELLFLRVAA